MKCSNCGFDYSISNSYCPKCGENNSEYNRLDTTRNNEVNVKNNSVSEDIYHQLTEKIKRLFDASLQDGESDVDVLIFHIDDEIENSLEDVDNLKDYVLFHDNWKERDRLIHTTHRCSFILIKKEFSIKIKDKLETETYQSDPGEYLFEIMDQEELNDAFSNGLISETGEIHPLGYTEWPKLITSKMETYDYNLGSTTSNLIDSKYIPTKKKNNSEHILFLTQMNDKEIDIHQYDVLYIDEFYRSDAYIFIPLEKNYTKIDIEQKMQFVYAEESKLLLGVYFNDSFYKRTDMWMSFNDRDLNEINLVTLEEFIQIEYIEE